MVKYGKTQNKGFLILGYILIWLNLKKWLKIDFRAFRLESAGAVSSGEHKKEIYTNLHKF